MLILILWIFITEVLPPLFMIGLIIFIIYLVIDHFK